MKRQRILEKLTKVKFLMQKDETMSGEESFKMRDIEDLRKFMDTVALSLNSPTKHWGSS